MAAKNFGRVNVSITASTGGLTAGLSRAGKQMERMESSVSSLRSSMGKLVAIQGAQLFGSMATSAMSAARSLLDLGRSAASGIAAAVGHATDLGEETSKSGVIFGESADRVMQFARSADSIGLTTAAALQATGSFGNLFTAMGLGSAQAADYATTLTALGADLASFNNATVDEAVLAVGAALRGESEPIRRFGVLLDEATLKQEALAKGLISSTSGSLTPAIKAQAAYSAILKQTTAAQGDFARTSGSLANLSRIVQAQAGNVMGDVGSAFEPLFRAAMSAISEVLTAVQPFVSQVSDAVRSSIEVIGAAIQLLVPQFTAFVGTLDGGNIGKVIGDGIMQGARFLAEIGDYIIQNFSSVFQYLTQIGAQWSAVFDLGSRVASFFGAVGDTLQAVFGVIILGITGPVESLIGAAKTIGDALYLDTSSLDSALAGMEAFNNKITEDISANGKSAYKGFRDALSADAAPVGEAIAGPLTATLDSAIAHARAAAATVDEKTQGSVRKVLDTEVKATVNTDALKAIVVGTSEGEAFRNSLLRGADPRNAGAEEEKRTADATEETAAGVDELVSIMRDQFAIAEITV
jgi:hypothetical protein